MGFEDHKNAAHERKINPKLNKKLSKADSFKQLKKSPECKIAAKFMRCFDMGAKVFVFQAKRCGFGCFWVM
jgi:hypothetical protein